MNTHNMSACLVRGIALLAILFCLACAVSANIVWYALQERLIREDVFWKMVLFSFTAGITVSAVIFAEYRTRGAYRFTFFCAMTIPMIAIGSIFTGIIASKQGFSPILPAISGGMMMSAIALGVHGYVELLARNSTVGRICRWLVPG